MSLLVIFQGRAPSFVPPPPAPAYARGGDAVAAVVHATVASPDLLGQNVGGVTQRRSDSPEPGVSGVGPAKGRRSDIV